MEESDPKWLECILLRHGRDNCVAKVISLNKETVVSKGDNYVSDMSRLKMDVILGSGKKTQRTIIVKQLPSTQLRAKHIRQWGVFKLEIKMYTEILPSMSDLLQEVGNLGGPLWIRCLGYQEFDRIVLEDLKEMGFTMADRKKGLNLAQSELVLKSLGKFHALSAVLKERGLLQPEEFEPKMFNFDVNMLQEFHNSAFNNLIEVIENTWEPEWKPYAEIIRKELIGNTAQRLIEIHKGNIGDFNVLNHGDCWVNNMLFKYIPGTDIPCDLRFVDFQVSCFNTYGLDLQYFLNTSVMTDIKEKGLCDLLKVYQEALVKYLIALGYANDNIPTMDDVLAEYSKSALFGMVVAATGLPFMVTQPEDVPDMELMFKELEETQHMTMAPKPYYGQIFKQRIQYVLKNFFQV